MRSILRLPTSIPRVSVCLGEHLGFTCRPLGLISLRTAHFILSLPAWKPGTTIPQRVQAQIKAPSGTSIIYQGKGCFQQNQVSQRGRFESPGQLESGTFPRGSGVSAGHIPGEAEPTLCQELCWDGGSKMETKLGLKQFPVHRELSNLHWIFMYIF